MASTSNIQPRAYAAAHFALELDGKDNVGLFRSIEGGSIKLDVMTYQNGGNYDRWHQLGKPKFEDIKLQVGMAMSAPFYDWIKHFFEGAAVRKNGAIVAADFYYKERARRTFTAAMITELTFPKLDGSDKSAAYMSIALGVENIVFEAGRGVKLDVPTGFDVQKLWTACNFDFELSGFPDSAVRRVSKIDSFTVKQKVVEYHQGGQLSPTKTPSQMEFPNIVFYVPEVDAQPYADWVTNNGRIAISNDVGTPSQLHGSITTYDNSRKDLFSVAFTGADIISVTPDKSDSSSEDIKMVKVELYTEKMVFTYGGVGAPQAPTPSSGAATASAEVDVSVSVDVTV